MPPPTAATDQPNIKSVPTIVAALRLLACINTRLPSAPAPADENPTSNPIGNAKSGSRFGRSVPVAPLVLRSILISVTMAITKIVPPTRVNTTGSRFFFESLLIRNEPPITPGIPPISRRSNVFQCT